MLILCQAPYWGYFIRGALTVTYTDVKTEDTHAGDIFYWPPGYTVKVNQDAKVFLFTDTKIDQCFLFQDESPVCPVYPAFSLLHALP